MAEKDSKKVDEKAGTQMDTVQLTPEMTLFLSALTNTYQTIQKNMAGPPLPAPEQTQQKEFTDNAKIAVEKFNDILAGLEFKPPLTPALNPFAPPDANLKVLLTWRMPTKVDTLTGFRIQRAQLPNETFIDLLPVLGPEKTSHEDGPLTAGTTYRYRVVALTKTRGEFVSNGEEIKIP
jgi:hypothetical protein